MATATTKKKATQTKSAAKSTAHKASTTTKQAGRTVRTVFTDGAYAVVGLGDTAVGLLRTLPEQLEKLRTEAPKALESFEVRLVRPAELRQLAESARVDAEKEFGALAQRGRSLVTTINNSAATQRAFEQTRTAQTQVKAAVTSVRRAVTRTAEAVETATSKVG